MFASSFAHAKRQILTFVIKLFCACFWLDKTREWCPYLKRFSFTKSALFHSEFYILVRCDAHESTCFQRAWPVKEGMRALVETTTATRYCLEFKCLTTLTKDSTTVHIVSFKEEPSYSYICFWRIKGMKFVWFVLFGRCFVKFQCVKDVWRKACFSSKQWTTYLPRHLWLLPTHWKLLVQ